MKLTVFNLGPHDGSYDGQPVLLVEAETLGEKKRLRELEQELNNVQLIAVSKGKAGIYNACGSHGGGEGISRFYIHMKLGGDLPAPER